MRNILVIAPTPFFADRGCHVRILGEVKALKEMGYSVKICTYHIGQEIDGIETVRIPNIPWYRKLSAGPSIHKFYLDLLLLWKVLITCKTFSPDIIHAHLHEGMMIGRIASMVYRCPMVADLQGSLTEEVLDHHFIPQWRWLVQSVRWIEGRINRMPKRLIASSTQTTQLVRERFGVKNDVIDTICDGVDLDVFFPREQDLALRSSLGISPDDRVVVFIGVLTPYQGIDILLDSIVLITQHISNVKFLIIGFPEGEYRKKAKMMGIEKETIFAGKIPYTDSARYLALGTLAVSPKISVSEANLKLYVYMAMGLPTVVFDNPVNREILGELGEYAKDRDAESLEQSLVKLLKDDQLATKLGEQCYQRAATCYSWRVVGDRLAEVYQKAICADG